MKDQELIDSINAMIVAEGNKLLANAPCSCWSCLPDANPTKVDPSSYPRSQRGPIVPLR